MSVAFIVVLLVTGILIVEGQRFDQCSDLRRCDQELDKYNRPNLQGRLSSFECREIIQNLNCVLKLIGCVREEERQNYGTKLQRARDTHKSSCENDEWDKRSNCYNSNEIRRCEDNFPRRAVVYNRENCMKFDQFQNCLNNAMGRLCRTDDADYLQVYMIDMARELTWKCPQYSSSFSPTSSSPSWSGNGRGPYNNTGSGSIGTFNEPICCRNEVCGSSRLEECRKELREIIDNRNRDPYPRDQKSICGSLLNRFNCYLWHNYKCVGKYEKDSDLLRRARESIDNQCDARGDVQRSNCYTRSEIRNCERQLEEDSRSREVGCREYKVFYDCVDRHTERMCDSQDKLLFGYYLVSKVSEKAWTCSLSDGTYHTSDSYDSSSPYDQNSCESRARSNYRHCDQKMDEFENAARNTANSRERHTKSCCSALTYRECIRQVVKQQCSQENSAVVEKLMGSSIRYRLENCDDVQYSTCSGTRILSNMLFMVVALFFSKIYFKC